MLKKRKKRKKKTLVGHQNPVSRTCSGVRHRHDAKNGVSVQPRRNVTMACLCNLEIFAERNKCLKRFFLDLDDRKNATMEFGLFSRIKAYDDDNMDDR